MMMSVDIGIIYDMILVESFLCTIHALPHTSWPQTNAKPMGESSCLYKLTETHGNLLCVPCGVI